MSSASVRPSRYRLVEVIGKGGMGEVWLADDLMLERRVALKFLTAHLAPHLGRTAAIVIAACRDLDAASAERSGMARRLDQLVERVRGHKRGPRSRATPLTRMLDHLGERRLVRVMRLSPLAEGDVGSLLAALAGQEAPVSVVSRFVDETGGSPFFVEELFRHLQEEGRLFDIHGRWRSDLGDEEIDVPAGVRSVIERRLGRVDERARSLLTAAAVVGPHFELDLIEAITSLHVESMSAALEVAEQAHLVKGPSGRHERRWRFAHQMIRQSLISTLPLLFPCYDGL